MTGWGFYPFLTVGFTQEWLVKEQLGSWCWKCVRACVCMCCVHMCAHACVHVCTGTCLLDVDSEVPIEDKLGLFSVLLWLAWLVRDLFQHKGEKEGCAIHVSQPWSKFMLFSQGLGTWVVGLCLYYLVILYIYIYSSLCQSQCLQMVSLHFYKNYDLFCGI